jgi:hypothetical protein
MVRSFNGLHGRANAFHHGIGRQQLVVDFP